MNHEKRNNKASVNTSTRLICELFTTYLKTFSRFDFVVILFVLAFGSIISFWLFSDNVDVSNKTEGLIITISNFSALVIFVIPFSVTIMSLNFENIFKRLDNESQNIVLERKLFFSVAFTFIRILFLSVSTLVVLWGFVGLMWQEVFANSNLLSIIAYSLIFITFWFLLATVCLDVLPKKYLTTITQLISIILITSGGYIIPAISFPPALNTLSQISPSRAIGDILLYNFLGTRIPGGAIVTFFEFLVVFACIFVLILRRCKNNRRTLFF